MVSQLKREHGGAGRILAAHFNHHWRGEESEADEQFVVQLAEELQVPLFRGNAETSLGGPQTRRSEQTARNLRYDFWPRSHIDKVPVTSRLGIRLTIKSKPYSIESCAELACGGFVEYLCSEV